MGVHAICGATLRASSGGFVLFPLPDCYNGGMILTGKPATTVRQVPDIPTVVWDGDCGFCRSWVEHWKELTGEAIEYKSYQEVAHRYPEIGKERFAGAVYYIEPDGTAWRGAGAALAVLYHIPAYRWLWVLYLRVPGFAPLARLAYRIVAANRPFFSRFLTPR